MSELIHERIEKHSVVNAGKIAIICASKTLSYGEVQARVEHWSSIFADRQCRSVAVLLANSAELLCMFVAASKLNINFQILSTDWPLAQISKVLDQLTPDLTVTKDDICAHPVGAYGLSDLSEARNKEEVEFETCDPSLAFYTGFTSGSTGLPKGFVRSQQSWLKSFISDQIRFKFEESDCFFVMGSLSHSLPLYGAVRGLYQGASVYISTAFRPDKLVRDCVSVDASVIYGTPTQYRALLDFALKEEISLSSVRLILSAGSKYPTDWFVDLKAVFCNAKAIEFFGTSELSYVAARQMKADDPPTLVGEPMPMVDIQILTADGRQAKTGENGSIFVKSPFMFLGYLDAKGQADRSSCEFQDGYLSVADSGHVDVAGRLHIRGRSDRVFQASGRTINPEGIEAIFAEDKHIQNIAVFGQPDPLREHKITAVIKFLEASDVARVIRDISQKLPKYMIPTDIYKCEEWPLTHSHKTDYPKLKALMYAKKLEKLK